MKYPNLYIIGAPKCGTTSIAKWLSEHPDIFLAGSKEPHHFNTDHNFLNYEKKNEYLSLYKERKEKYLVDASVWYLYSKEAIPNVLNVCKQAKFIVCLRNPTDMALSLYLEQVFATNENIDNFQDAWKASPQRRVGKNVSNWCREPLHLDYQKACSLGEQVQRLLKLVAIENIKFVTIDEVINEPKELYLNLARFLGVEVERYPTFTNENKAKMVKYKQLKRLVRILGKLRALLPFRRLGLLTKLNAMNKKSLVTKPVISKEFRRQLDDFYKDDIKALEKLINLDLSAWYHENEK